MSQHVGPAQQSGRQLTRAELGQHVGTAHRQGIEPAVADLGQQVETAPRQPQPLTIAQLGMGVVTAQHDHLAVATALLHRDVAIGQQTGQVLAIPAAHQHVGRTGGIDIHPALGPLVDQHVGKARPTEHQVATLTTLDQHVGRTGTVEVDIALGHVGFDDVAATSAVKEDVTLALAATLLTGQQQLAGELAGGRQSIRHGRDGVELVAHLAQGVAPRPHGGEAGTLRDDLIGQPRQVVALLVPGLGEVLERPGLPVVGQLHHHYLGVGTKLLGKHIGIGLHPGFQRAHVNLGAILKNGVTAHLGAGERHVGRRHVHAATVVDPAVFGQIRLYRLQLDALAPLEHQIAQPIGAVGLRRDEAVVLVDLTTSQPVELVPLLVPGGGVIAQGSTRAIIGELYPVDLGVHAIEEGKQVGIGLQAGLDGRDGLGLVDPAAAHGGGSQRDLVGTGAGEGGTVAVRALAGEMVVAPRPLEVDVALGHVRQQPVVAAGPVEVDVATGLQVLVLLVAQPGELVPAAGSVEADIPLAPLAEHLVVGTGPVQGDVAGLHQGADDVGRTGPREVDVALRALILAVPGTVQLVGRPGAAVAQIAAVGLVPELVVAAGPLEADVAADPLAGQEVGQRRPLIADVAVAPLVIDVGRPAGTGKVNVAGLGLADVGVTRRPLDGQVAGVVNHLEIGGTAIDAVVARTGIDGRTDGSDPDGVVTTIGTDDATEAIGIDIIVSVICRVITGKEVLNTSPYTLSHVLTHYD